MSVPYDQGVEGCEIDLLQGGPNGPVQGTFLWRFAVLFAVDKGAHTLASWLPIAPRAEVAAVEG